MARIEEALGELGFWRRAPRYDGADFDLAHLRPLDRIMIARTGESIPLLFRFSYHCCTDKPGKRDLGTRILEETRPSKDRYFCPVRWFLSAVARAGAVFGHRSAYPGARFPMAAYRTDTGDFAAVGRVDEDHARAAGGRATVVGVESAYLAGAPPRGGQPGAFRFIIEQMRRQGRLYGMPPRDRT